MALALAMAACGGEAAAPDAGDAASACLLATPWAIAPDVPTGPIQETAAVALDGKVYVLGGFNAALGVVADVQIFDPSSCRWSSGPALPRPVHHANVAAVGDAIYVVGAMEGLNFRATGEVWVWRPAADAGWSTRTAMPAGTERGAAVVGVIDDEIWVVGGLGVGGAVSEVSRYLPATDRWETGDALPEIRDHACGGVIDGQVYVAGGRRGTIATITDTLYAYAPGSGWVARAPMPTARGGTACGVVADRLVVVGGEGNSADPSGVFAAAEAYDPTTDRWSALPPMPRPRHGMAAAVVDGRLYVPGGADNDGFGAVAEHDVLTP